MMKSRFSKLSLTFNFNLQTILIECFEFLSRYLSSDSEIQELHDFYGQQISSSSQIKCAFCWRFVSILLQINNI